MENFLRLFSKEEIDRNLSILEVADVLGISLKQISSGHLDFRTRCPSPKHNDGTASFSVNSEDNNYFCFGCKSGGSTTDFYILCTQLDFKEAITELSQLIEKSEIIDPSQKEDGYDVLYFVIRLSKLFRQIQTIHFGDRSWAEQLMEQYNKRLLQLIDETKSYNLSKVTYPNALKIRNLVSQAEEMIRQRYQ